MALFHSPSVKSVTVTDEFLRRRIETNHSSTIPQSIKRSEETGRIDAFKLEWKPGMPNKPHIYWDSDVAKILEGMALAISIKPDPRMEKRLEEIIALVVSAQQPDGYLNTYFTSVDKSKRWTNLHVNHELYCAGHLIEAAVAHFKATGRRNFLDCVCRYADYIDTVFGRGKGKKRGYPGHEELELALCKLYEVTGKKKYLNLAKYFIDERGRKPNYFFCEKINSEDLVNLQAVVPVREQKTAMGHAVRAVYLYSGMADVADKTGDKELLETCKTIFKSISERKMFITGGIGSSIRGNEAFENDYKLQNLDSYNESCASIGLIFFAQRMHNITGDTAYLDVIERALYNGTMCGISLSGDKFFYQNPLRTGPDSVYARTRQPWFFCSCCPTSFCRFMPQIGSFLWSENETGVRLNIPAASVFESAGRKIRVSGGYPYDGRVKIGFLSTGKYAFSVRIPAWCSKFTVKLNGKKAAVKKSNGAITFDRCWKSGDEIILELDMPVQLVRANANVDDDTAKAAIVRGPVVYALESTDNGPGLGRLAVPSDAKFKLGKARGLPPETVSISGTAVEIARPGNDLYSTAKPRLRNRKITAIPYSLWQNRDEPEMLVWLHELI